MDNCTFRVGFPAVMKMQILVDFEAKISTSLREIQEIVFKKFWENAPLFTSMIVHGKIEQVTLIDRNTPNGQEEVKDEADFQARLRKALAKQSIYVGTIKVNGKAETFSTQTQTPVVCFDAYFSKEAHNP